MSKNKNAAIVRSIPVFPGVPVMLKGEAFLLPSLTLGQFEDNYALLTSNRRDIAAADLKGFYGEYLTLIGSAFRLNYPEITDDYLKASITLSGFNKLLKIVQGASGLEEVEPGE